MLFGDSPSPGLVGIAKLAAHSEGLEAKRVVQYFELESRSVLNRTRPGMPFEWSLNPYRGCEFGCRYCYARYTHEFMELRESVDFEDRIYAKSSIGPILRQELKRIRGGKAIAIGTATDPYPKFVTRQAETDVSPSESAQAMAESTLHSRLMWRCSGRLMPSCLSSDFCSAVGSVMRRRRISRPSVVGRTMSALCRVESSAIALMGDIGWASSTPLGDGFGTIAGIRFSRCFNVTHNA